MSRGLRTAATAVYFAEALGRGDRDLSDAPRLDELADHAHDLADSTESEEILRLAEATDTAHRMMCPPPIDPGLLMSKLTSE
ncbi:hypothetical protein [Streptomyces iakyrus]|uniref:hypothetical protein n=1 Tax=Streptomyces iakyrus TaxID=68219 RepID=UPI0005247CB4|nr:hypothetical protein [Streptomyces iakyrus]